MRNGEPRLRREAGFTYVGLIVLVAIIGLVGAATLKADALLRRAAAEEELLEIGAAFSAALTSYAEATPRGQPAQPPSLEELLKDPRFPGVRRHLRKIFVDPITGKAEWGIVWLNKGTPQRGVGGYSPAAACWPCTACRNLASR
jgi:type II secretory pathway pseudopilin PulG